MDVTVRPLAADDIDAGREVQQRAFEQLDRAAGHPVPEATETAIVRQRERFQHFLDHDPAGSWVAVVDGAVIGVALALRRESLWGLSLLVVDPHAQSSGVGRKLLDASLQHADGTDSAVILSSSDPRAMRRYAVAGFALHPQVEASGPLDRSLLPKPSGRIRDGDASRIDWADELDRRVRGSARGPDHEILQHQGRMFVIDDTAGQGYAYLRADGRIVTVVTTDDDTATALLWECLAAERDSDRSVDHINAKQQWAIRVALEARLKLEPAGPVFWRGRAEPPACYLPDGAYL